MPLHCNGSYGFENAARSRIVVITQVAVPPRALHCRFGAHSLREHWERFRLGIAFALERILVRSAFALGALAIWESIRLEDGLALGGLGERFRVLTDTEVWGDATLTDTAVWRHDMALTWQCGNDRAV
jgi:hypothetical protein